MAKPHHESRFSCYIISPSLLENLSIHPAASDNFQLTMEEWTEAYLNCLEDELSQNVCEPLLELSTNQLPNRSQYSLHPPIPASSGHAHTGSKRILMQPHPQDLEPPPTK